MPLPLARNAIVFKKKNRLTISCGPSGIVAVGEGRGKNKTISHGLW